MVVRTGAAALKRSLPAALADDSSELSGEMREMLSEMSQWLGSLEQRIASCETRITRQFKHDERCQRLAAVPGVPVPLTATARWWPQWVMRTASGMDAELSAYFWGWFRASIPRAARPCCSGITKHAVTAICAPC